LECQKFRNIVCAAHPAAASCTHRARRSGFSTHADHILKEHAMWINTPHARLADTPRRALRLHRALGTELRAVDGTVWITINDDPRDIVLDAGEAFVVDSPRDIVVLPIGERATLDVCHGSRRPAQVTAWHRQRTAPWHERVGAWLQGRWLPRPA
jgi:hypothetical protein